MFFWCCQVKGVENCSIKDSRFFSTQSLLLHIMLWGRACIKIVEENEVLLGIQGFLWTGVGGGWGGGWSDLTSSLVFNTLALWIVVKVRVFPIAQSGGAGCDAGCGELGRGVGQNLARMSACTTFYCAQHRVMFFKILYHILLLSLCSLAYGKSHDLRV